MRLIVLALLLAAGVAAAADTPFTEAQQVFMRAQQGQEKDVEPAIAAFEALARAEPRNPAYAAYLGSATTLKGRDALMPWNRVKYVEEGLDRLDGALAGLKPEHDKELLRGVPVSMEARLVAANTFMRLPDGIFHRRAQGKKLVADLLKDPTLAAAPASFRAAVDKAAAEAARP
ncbi:MAG TPA: hypothetical protein VIF38_12400 [Burkholderiales bacterium]|jgi:hypothetical protein